jgi:hypothetical protein
MELTCSKIQQEPERSIRSCLDHPIHLTVRVLRVFTIDHLKPEKVASLDYGHRFVNHHSPRDAHRLAPRHLNDQCPFPPKAF